MRIAYLINQYPKISHTFVRREIMALERRGIEVIRIALRGWDAELVDDEDHMERERTHYILRGGIPRLLWALLRVLLTRPMAFMRALALACRMSRRSERPLPVHLAYLAEACCIALWLRGRKVEHVHAHFGTNSAEVAMLVHVLGGPSWSFTAHGPEEFDKQANIGLAEKVRRCAFVVAVSSYGRSQFYRIVGREHWPKVQLVHCGLEPIFFPPAPGGPLAGRRLVCVGRLSEQKGQLLLIEAARRLAGQGRQFELVLVGDGEMRAEIERLSERYKLQRHVHVTGWLSSTHVRDEITAARAMVLPSFAEGLPVVLMEAMALGRPVIATFVGGIPELVHPDENGWLVPAGDVDALADAMAACLDAPAARLAEMGAAGRKSVLAHHNVDTEAAKLAELFKAVVSQ